MTDSSPARASTRARSRPDAIERAMAAQLASRLHGARRLTDRHERLLRSVIRVGRAAGAESVDATLTPRGLFIAFGPASDGGPVPIDPALEASLARAFSVPVVAVDRADRPVFPPPREDADARVEAATLARDWLSRVRSLEDECARDEDVRGVHEIRIAIRRTRAALRWLSRCVRDPRIDEVTDALRALSAVTSPVRDADVVDALLAKRAPEGPARDAALAEIRVGRGARVKALRAHLRARAYRQSMVRADAALAELSASALPVAADALHPAELRAGERASRSFQRYFDRELRRIHARLEGDLTVDEGYHAVRRQLRRVRDIIDVGAPLLGARRRAWRTRLQPVQSQLGAFNDAVNALALVRAAGGPTREVARWLKDRRSSSLAELATPLAVLAVLVMAR
jgi:CHAD domain-containing protein